MQEPLPPVPTIPSVPENPPVVPDTPEKDKPQPPADASSAPGADQYAAMVGQAFKPRPLDQVTCFKVQQYKFQRLCC